MPRTEAVWTCEVSGPVAHADLPPGSDFPMRQAVRAAYREVTGQNATYLSSGWGGEHRVKAGGRTEFRLRWLIHLAHRGRRNDWLSTPFCFVCAARRLKAYREDTDHE